MCTDHGRSLRVPCGWPDCQARVLFANLSVHIRTKHNVNRGFGCDHCGFTNGQAAVVQLHVLEKHQRQDKIRPAAKALAQCYRTSYQQSDPEGLGQIAKKDWSHRGIKSNKKSFHSCETCGASISPATKVAFIRHLAQQHTIVVDLDYDRIKKQYAALLIDAVSSDQIKVGETNHSSTDDLNPPHHHSLDDDLNDYDYGDDDDDGGGESSSNSGDDVNVVINARYIGGEGSRAIASTPDLENNLPQPCERVIEQSATSASSEVFAPPILRERISASADTSLSLQRMFLSCVKESSLNEINEILTMYEVRSISGQQYRVHNSLPVNTMPDANIIHATPIANGWRCEVPQCGAILSECFITDLHLRAHGVTHLTQWYCMESTCSIDHERNFSDRQALDAHLAEEHMNSSFSLSAVSRVPEQGVLLFGSSSHLKLMFTHNQSLAQRSQTKRSGTKARTGQHDGSEVIKNTSAHDIRSYKGVSNVEVREESEQDSLELLLESIDTANPSDSDLSDTHDSESERTFSKHCNGQWVSLLPVTKSQRVLSALRPLLAPGTYMVETPKGHIQMTEKRARSFVKLYDQYRGTCDDPAQQSITIETMAVSSIAAPKETNDPVDSHDPHNKNIEHDAQQFVTVQYCPWLGCNHSIATDNTSMLVVHLMNRHLACSWQCREQGCDYCYYVHPWDLSRHRVLCHVGSSLQCGHRNCDRVLVNDRFYLSRGHVLWSGLQNHFQAVFNQELSNFSAHSTSSSSSKLRSLSPLPSSRLQTSLPSLAEYTLQFEQKSSSYFTPQHRERRSKQNHKLLQTSNINSPQIQIKGSHICEGFFYGDQHFPCADRVNLTLETGVLIFVPGLCVFTIAQTCDYCVYAMSLISRPLANPPLPYHFGPKGNGSTQRVGKGSEINDHASFKDLCSREPLCISSMAEEYAMLKAHNPRKIVIVDFETVRRSVKNLPLIPTEVTVRDGNGKIVVSCVINEVGVTNAAFVSKLTKLGYDRPSISAVSRIRGLPGDNLPRNAKSAKQIVSELVKAGLSPDCLWVEYSASGFDWRCMKVLIDQAEESVRSILPPKSKCWTVLPDFARCIPGLASYRLGRVLQLMDPYHESLSQLHWSGPDTAALYSLLENWIYVYGPL